MNPFELQLRTRLVFGAGALARLGELAADLGFRARCWSPTAGMVAADTSSGPRATCATAGLEVIPFHDFGDESRQRGRGPRRGGGAGGRIDSFVGLGGGSSLDCAKGINFVLDERREDGGLPGLGTRPRDRCSP